MLFNENATLIQRIICYRRRNNDVNVIWLYWLKYSLDTQKTLLTSHSTLNNSKIFVRNESHILSLSIFACLPNFMVDFNKMQPHTIAARPPPSPLQGPHQTLYNPIILRNTLTKFKTTCKVDQNQMNTCETY